MLSHIQHPERITVTLNILIQYVYSDIFWDRLQTQGFKDTHCIKSFFLDLMCVESLFTNTLPAPMLMAFESSHAPSHTQAIAGRCP